MSRNACNGGKLTEGWRVKLNANSGLLESGNFGEIGDFGNNGEKSPEGRRFKLDGQSSLLKSGVGD